MGKTPLKLFIDECLSPHLVTRLNKAGYHAVHPRNYGRTGELDHEVLQRCLLEDLTIVTENAIDFRKLVGSTELHPGLIILPSVGRDRSWSLLEAAIECLKQQGNPANAIVNQVLDVARDGTITLSSLHKSD